MSVAMFAGSFVLPFVVLLLAPPAAAQPFAGWTTTETEHFRIHVPPNPKIDPAAFGARQERALPEILTFFNVTLPGRIDYYVWNSGEEAQKELGRMPGFALPAALRIHIVPDQTPGHELTHVVVFHAVRPERSSTFIEEGTAVAFDLTGRDRVSVAREAIRRAGGPQGTVLDLWALERSDSVFYPVAGAFVERLIARGGRDRFLTLLKRQTIQNAREIYGADFDRIVSEFDADLGTQAPSQAPENPDWPSLETLRARAQERMRRDRASFTSEELQQLETLYQSANRALKAPGSKDILRQVIQKYPRSNRAGCAAPYLARLSEGPDQERLFLDAIKDHGDAMFGDGVQVGAMARAELAFLHVRNGRTTDAKKLADEVNQLYPGAVDHRGQRLAEGRRRLAASGGI
jgi:hypothetical protein